MELLLKDKKNRIQIISFQGVKEATKDFKEVIGTGGYGSVYKGQLKISEKLITVAVKINDKSGQGRKEFLNEINLLSDSKHPNLVSLLSVCEEGNKKVLIFEYASKGSLDRYLTVPETPCELTWKERIHICIGAAQGIDYLHNRFAENRRIIHRDIKSSNILLDQNLMAMISDLGLSKIGRANEVQTYVITRVGGTSGYCDPAYYSSGILTKESDIYSFGVVLFEVLSGRQCHIHVDGKKLAQLAKKYFKEEKLDDIVEPDLKNQIDQNSLFTFLKIAYDCLRKDRETRPPIAMVVRTLKDALKFQENGEKGLSSMNNEAYTKRDEFYKLPSKKDNVNMGNLRNVFQGNWTPISLPESWDQDVHPPKQSNLRFSTDKDLLVKCFSVFKKFLENNGGKFEDSYIKHWVDIVELFKEVSNCKNDSSGRVLYESVSCITIVISRVAQVLRASLATKHTEGATNGLQEILDHAKASGVVDALLSCLVTCGTSLMSESLKLLHAACEACEAIWSLIDAFEIQSSKEIAPEFPLRSMYSHSIDQLNTKEDERQPLMGKDSEEIVEAVTQAFLKYEAVQVSMFYCLRQHAKASWSSIIQILLRCCLRNVSVTWVVCGISNPLVVSGGGDNTIISEVFSIISFCASFDKDPQPGDTNSLKSKISDPSALISHSCLFVASVAQSLDSVETRSAIVMITSSPETQQSRLSDLAHHYSLCDETRNFQPHSMSAMLALASILSLEDGAPTERSISEIAFPLIPHTATLFDYLKLLTTDAEKDKTSKLMFSYLFGFRDACVFLLAYRLKWGGSQVIQDFVASDIPQTLINLLENKHSDEIGLSPEGVGWNVYLLQFGITDGDPVFRQLLLTREYAKVMCDLISDTHLKLIQRWGGLGGGKRGVGVIVGWVSLGLEYPFIEATDSPDWKDRATKITTMEMEMYIQVLVELGLAEKIIKCLEHLEGKYIVRSVSLVARMVFHQSLTVELRDKGFLSPNIMRRLLDDSTPIQVTINVVIIVSEFAKTDEEYCEHINGIDILEKMKRYLTHEDPKVRASTLVNLAYTFHEKSKCDGFLAKYNIISLLVDRLYDEDDTTPNEALNIIGFIAYHGDVFYEDLRICIPQLAKLLLSAEHNRTKNHAAICLGNLSCHSDKLSQDMISQGAMEALFTVVADCYDFALDPNKIDAINASPLYEALYALATMCKHLILRQFIRSSKVYPIIEELRQSPEEDIASYASLIFNRIYEQ